MRPRQQTTVPRSGRDNVKVLWRRGCCQRLAESRNPAFEEKSGGPFRTSAEWRVLRLHRHVEWFTRLAGDQFVIGWHLEQGSVRFPAIDVDNFTRLRANLRAFVFCQQRQLKI